MTIKLKYSYFLLSCFLICSVLHAQISRKTTDPNIKTLYTVFDKLKTGQYDKDKLYLDYFMQADKDGNDRSEKDKLYYKDTLFVEFHKILKGSTNFSVMPLKKAKEIIGDSIIDKDYYYDLQKDFIYVLVVDNKVRKYDMVGYLLAMDSKIVSLFGISQDNKLMWWK